MSSTDLEPSVTRLLVEGKKISAIKELRQLRGIGLKEAKELVDRYETENNFHRPKNQEAGVGRYFIPIAIVMLVGYLAYRSIFQ